MANDVPIIYRSDGTRMNQRSQDDVMSEILRLWSQLQLYRNTTAAQWEEVAELILPTSRNTFYFGNYNWPGQKKTDRQIDATGMMALHRFAAICDSLLTPRNMQWHALGSTNDAINKDRDCKVWFHQATKMLFKLRYQPIANFAAQNQNNYQSLGAFGTAGMFVDQAVAEDNTPLRALRYKSIPLGELFLMENHQGLVNGFIRWFRLDAAQACTRFGVENLPGTFEEARKQQSKQLYDFLHVVMPRQDFDPYRLDFKGKKYASYYVSLTGTKLVEEGGYSSFPLAASRYDQTPGEVYGRSPAMMVLPALKTLNAEKRTFLKQGHRAADPVLLTADDGLVDMNLTPGAINVGGVNSDGRPMVTVLPTGQIQVTKEMMDEERSLINDAFLVSLFQILTETPTMSATEVIERTNEKGILLAPTVGRQQSEYLGPMIERELDLMAQMGMLPPMPPLLREAKGEYEVVYTSPLSRAARSQEAAGFLRTVESVKELVNVTQDQSLLDQFNFDKAIPEIAEIQAVPITWMASPGEVAQKRDARAKALAREQQIQAMPAQAAMLKAQQAAPNQTNQPQQQPGAGQAPQGGPPGPPQMPGQ